MKIGLRAGHSDNCEGAVGIVNEHDQMKSYYTAVKSVFEKYGHTVIDCNSNANTENEELSEGANIANSNNVDFFASLHMNCFDTNAHGCEVLVSSASSGAYPVAQRLVQNFSELGFFNRGVKFIKDYEMNHISAPNIISEICFCDSQVDIDIYNEYSWEQLAYVFCNAIDSNIPKEIKYNDKKDTGYVVTNYLPNGNKGDGSFEGVDLDYVLSYLKDVKCYARGNEKGVWIETQVLPIDKCNELKNTLGSWFYAIE
ncbi:N-acetylmuramoyl-L-alanine amidase [Clostridium sp. BL-8]|uniref:N-acetylmuramoyl-L-alanine amidase n=1 Tax=Clostridium sp. BL-8 TaxID=349938 RepID=UPI00098C9065|nr:N-acetylmuramoyl-L-alanine amidase [Clostridium sp. BL-8]OOM69660.1 N-acetylmuramoyl-L-alanine amidase [Clostridium sp. BL-8]